MEAADALLGLTDAHEALRERVRTLAEEHITPILVETDSHERWPREVFQAFGAEGLLGGTLPKAYGGAGMDNVTLTVMCEEHFNDCRLPDDALVGEVGRGYRVALASVGYGRLQVAARHCGGIRACRDESVAWAKQRELYGRPIAEFQLIQTKIVDMALALDTGRYLTYRFAQMLDQGLMARREGSMAKVYTAEALMRCAHDAMQIQGARSIGEESAVGRQFRDAKVSEIVEGANEVQRTLIAEYELGIRE